MVVNREYAEGQVALCENGIADQNERYRKGLISRDTYDLEVRRLVNKMATPQLLLEIWSDICLKW